MGPHGPDVPVSLPQEMEPRAHRMTVPGGWRRAQEFRRGASLSSARSRASALLAQLGLGTARAKPAQRQHLLPSAWESI